MAPRKFSKPRRHPPRTGESKKSSGQGESSAPAPVSNSAHATVGTDESKESSGRDESESPACSSSLHATPGTGESKESSGEGQSKPPAGLSSPQRPPRPHDSKHSSGGNESKAPVPGSSSPRRPPRPYDSKDSSGGDESKAPVPGSSSPRPPASTTDFKESSGADQSKTPTPSASSSRPPVSTSDSKEASGADQSKAPTPGASSPRAPISTTDSKESSSADQSKTPTPGASSPRSVIHKLPLFGLVVGPDKSNSPPGKGRFINPTLRTAGPKECPGTDKSQSERARTSQGAPVAESSSNIPQSTDQRSHASSAADRSIVPPVTEGSEEDSVAEATSNTPKTSEQSDASPGAVRSIASPATHSPVAASIAECTSKAAQTTKKSFAESMGGSASTSRKMTEKYHMTPVARILTGVAKPKPGRSIYRDRTTLLADTSVYLPPGYTVKVQIPPSGICRSRSLKQGTEESQSSSGLDESTTTLAKDGAKDCTVGSETLNAPPSTDVSQMSSITYKLKEISTAEGSKTSDIQVSKASPSTGKSTGSTVPDEPKSPRFTDKRNVPKPTDQYARKWGSKLGSPVIDRSKSISAPCMETNPLTGSSDHITSFGLVVGPDPSCSPTGKGRFIRPVVRPKESQRVDKSKSEGIDKSTSEKSEGLTEKSKSESAVLDGLMGKEDKLASVPMYISGSTDNPSAIILISDIYGTSSLIANSLCGKVVHAAGIDVKSCPRVADKVAAAGYLAVIPDYFNGDPYKMVEGENPMSAFPDWLAKHPAATVENVELTKKLIESIKDNYGTTYVGLAGFGYGAKIAVTVGKDHDAKAIVQLNPLFVEASDYEEVSVPIAVVAAPEDGVDKHTAILKSRSKKLKIVVKIYKGAVPGWPVRYDEKDPTAVRIANSAHKVMLDWFSMYM